SIAASSKPRRWLSRNLDAAAFRVGRVTMRTRSKKKYSQLPMSTKVEATIEDLYKVEGKAELVNGEIEHMSPTGLHPHYAALQIAISLQAYEMASQSGFAVCDNVGFIVDLPHRTSFSPDAAFYVGEDS